MKLKAERTPITRICAYSLLIAAVALPDVALAQVYRWTDENGRVIVSDTPPPTGSAKKISKGSPTEAQGKAAAPKASPPTLDPEVEKRVKQNEAAEKAQEDKRQAELQEYCESSKQRLSQLESGERVGVRDRSGARQIMNSQQRAEEIAKLRERRNELKCP